MIAQSHDRSDCPQAGIDTVTMQFSDEYFDEPSERRDVDGEPATNSAMSEILKKMSVAPRIGKAKIDSKYHFSSETILKIRLCPNFQNNFR